MSNRIIPVDQGMLGKVNQKSGKLATGNVADARARPADKAAPVESAAADTVELTGSGRLLAQASETLATLSPIDTVKVDEVRRAIEEGEYVIDADKITDALLRADMELRK